MFRIILKVLVLHVMFTSTVLSQETLQYKLKVNDTLSFLQEADQNIVQTMDGNKHLIDNHMEGIFTFFVKKVTDSSYVMDFKFAKFYMQTKSNMYGNLFEVNTDSLDMDNAQSRVFEALTKTSLTLEMLKTGKIIYLKGTDVLVKKMIEGAGFDNDFTKAVMMESMNKEFGENKMINSLEQFTFIYTQTPVKNNDSWTNKYTGALNSENTWKLIKIDNENTTIEGSSQVAMKSNDESMQMALKGTSNTLIICNKKSGVAKNMVVESTMEGLTILKDQEAMKIPTTIISKTTYKAL